MASNTNPQAATPRLRPNPPSIVELIDRRDPSPTMYLYSEPGRTLIASPKRSRVLPWILLGVLFAAGVAFYLTVFMEASK